MNFRNSDDIISLVCAILLFIIAIFLLIPAIDSNVRTIHIERNYQNIEKNCIRKEQAK